MCYKFQTQDVWYVCVCVCEMCFNTETVTYFQDLGKLLESPPQKVNLVYLRIGAVKKEIYSLFLSLSSSDGFIAWVEMLGST